MSEQIQLESAEKCKVSRKLCGYSGNCPVYLENFIEAIYVEVPDKSSGKRGQTIHIKYDGTGFIPLNELMQKETA